MLSLCYKQKTVWIMDLICDMNYLTESQRFKIHLKVIHEGQFWECFHPEVCFMLTAMAVRSSKNFRSYVKDLESQVIDWNVLTPLKLFLILISFSPSKDALWSLHWYAALQFWLHWYFRQWILWEKMRMDSQKRTVKITVGKR